MPSIIEKDSLVLFQGDSITDSLRRREDPADLGMGYPLFAAGLFTAKFPEKNVTFLNRGIGGDRIQDLHARWETDALALKPSVISILIGINNVWRFADGSDSHALDGFEDRYRELLVRTRQRLPNVRLLIMEPFLLSISPQWEANRQHLDPVISGVRRLAREFNAAYAPLDGLFAAACSRREPTYWAGDGVHPTPAGHALIAKAWLDAAGVDA